MPVAVAVAEPVLPVLHLGKLETLLELPGDSVLPLVTAKVLTTLVPCEKRVPGDTRLHPIALDTTEAKPQPLRLQKKNREGDHRLYYVCTMCGWSGSGRQRHLQQRPDCEGVPCAFVPEGGKGKDEAVKFIARCTPQQARPRRLTALMPHHPVSVRIIPTPTPERPHHHYPCAALQRRHGLPPDGEMPVPKRNADGTLDTNVLYLAVPADAIPGTQARVRVAPFTWDLIHVPEHLKPGDVMQVNIKQVPAKERRKKMRADADGAAAAAAGGEDDAAEHDGMPGGDADSDGDIERARVRMRQAIGTG